MPRTRREKKTPHLAVFYLSVFLVVAIDQLTKFLALNFLSPNDSIPVIAGIFHLTLVRNTGIAFGLFRDHPSLLLALITLSLAALFILGARAGKISLAPRAALVLIIGGALGNWIDRLRFGSVVDFLDFRIWPVFNFADSAITVGVAIYLLIFFKRKL